jgi:hypothetical protein
MRDDEIIDSLLKRVEFDYDPNNTAVSENTRYARKHFDDLMADRIFIKRKLTSNPNYQENLQHIWELPEHFYSTKGKLFSEYQRENLKSLLQDQLVVLKGSEEGKLLLNNIERTINGDYYRRNAPSFRIVITNKTNNRYNISNNRVLFNPWDTVVAHDENNRIKLFDLMPLIQGINSDKSLVKSEMGLSPAFLGVAHELIHYTDYSMLQRTLEGNRPGYKIHSSRLQSILPDEELGAFLEHKAIFDDHTFAISELKLRRSAQEPLRYLHTGYTEDMALYEPIETVIKKAIVFVPAKEKMEKSLALANYLSSLPIANESIISTDEIFSPAMKVRLASRNSIFEQAFNSHVRQSRQSFINKFLEYKLSPQRIDKLYQRYKQNTKLLSVLDKNYDFMIPQLESFGFTPPQLASAYIQSQHYLKRSFLSTLRYNLQAKLERNKKQLDILAKLRIPRGGELLYTPDVFYKIAGIPTPRRVREAPF